MIKVLNKNNIRIIYIDLLRVVSTFAVVILHVAASKWGTVDMKSTDWQILNIYDSAVRWCVPIFFMISGVFFLNPEKEIKIRDIYSKYILRIVIALIVTSIFYILYLGIIDHLNIDFKFLINAVKSVVEGNVRYHLWFLYVIIGLYIVTPILRLFIKSANKNEIEYFIFIAIIFSVIVPFLLYFYPFNRILISFNKLNIPSMIQYSLYYVSGYYFANVSFDIRTRYKLYLGVVGAFAFTILMTFNISINTGSANSLYYGYLTPNVMIMSFGVFTLFKEFFSKIKFSTISVEVIKLLSDLSFTTYLVHDAVIISLERVGINAIIINPIIGVPIISILIFFISLSIAYLLNRINKILKGNFNLLK